MRLQFDDRQRVRGVVGKAAVIGVGDDVAGEAALVQPARQGKDAALRAAELLDLGDDDRAGVGGGLVVRHRLALGERVQGGEEFGEGDRRGFCALDLRVAFGAQRGDREGHGDAVVGGGVDGRSVEGLTAGDLEAVGKLRHFSSHGAEISGHQRDAVGLLDPKFLGVAKDQAVCGVRRNGGENGKLVDDLRGERAADGKRLGVG